MAHTIAITKLLDGPRHAIYHVYLVCDGASGELVDQTLIDPVDLVPSSGAVPSLTIEEINYDLSGFSARLEFDYLVSDTGAWVMSADNHACVNLAPYGGIKDRSNVLDGTGKLMMSTKGFTSADDAGVIVLKVRKN